MSPTNLNALALTLKSLHRAGAPLLLTNVYDAPTATVVSRSSSSYAIATASFAIAATQGVEDDAMTWAQNKAGITNVIAGMKNAGVWGRKPLTADLQDGYEDVKGTVREAIEEGVVGCNIEDYDGKRARLRGKEEAVSRIKLVLEAARESGVPDFVVNARTDVLGFDGGVEDVIDRGKAFLAAGATTVFVWGVGKHDITEEEVKRMVKELGMLAVQPGVLTVPMLRDCGVSRISVGPMLFRKAMEVFEKEALRLLYALDE